MRTSNTLVPVAPAGQAEVIYVAVSAARGHLMRASQVCPMLHENGLRVTPMIFGRRGLDFFRSASGMDGVLLSPGYANAYGPDHSQDVPGSTRNIFDYTFSTSAARDMGAITRRMIGARVLVNDLSTSPPAAALAYLVGGPHLINVISENNYYALVNIDKLNRRSVTGRIAKHLLDTYFYAASINFINTMQRSKWFTHEGGLCFLPPFTQIEQTARPSPCRFQGTNGRAQRLFVAYFNPEYKNPSFIGHLIEAARKADATLHLVSEYAAEHHADLESGTVQIVRQDFGLATLIKRADLVITAAGLAMPMQAYVSGTPLLVVVNRAHVEHARNADVIAREGMGHVIDDFSGAPEAVFTAMDKGQEPHPWIPTRTREAWRTEIMKLVDSPALKIRGAQPVFSAIRHPLVY